MKYLLLLLIPLNVWADQISYSESSLINQTSLYYTSKDRRVQYNYGDEEYLFFQIRRAGVCAYYCGFNYDMKGVGFGKYYKGTISVFAQAGYYFIDNTFGYKKGHDERINYYLVKRFGEPGSKYRAYEVQNKDTFGITLGLDAPLSKNAGIKVSYQYMKVKERIIGWFDHPPVSRHWHDPRHRDLSTISAGIYYNF